MLLFPLVESKSNCFPPGRASARWWGTRGWGMPTSCIFYHSRHHSTSLLWSLLFRLELGRRIWVHWALRKLLRQFCVQVLSSHASHGGAVLQAKTTLLLKKCAETVCGTRLFLGPHPWPSLVCLLIKRPMFASRWTSFSLQKFSCPWARSPDL